MLWLCEEVCGELGWRGETKGRGSWPDALEEIAMA